jgi:dihydropyrimidinase
LPVLLTHGHHRRGLPLEKLIPLVSENPARRMGLHHKGALRPGADADIAVVDLKADWTLGKEHVHSDAGYSIYEGERMQARVIHTLSRGRFALRDGALEEATIGCGRFVHRALA